MLEKGGQLYALLVMMSDGRYHSGETLGELLGVSRTAVWKQLKKLEGVGFLLESSKGRGYRLLDPVELLDKDLIVGNINEGVRNLVGRFSLCSVAASTNQLALDSIQCDAGKGDLFVAEQQTVGRGRLGRSWYSPFGKNLYFSVVWEFSSVAALQGLSLAVGVAIADVLEREGAVVQLKWPNDLLSEGKKLGGILIELVGDLAGSCKVVIGVGVNVKMKVAAEEVVDQPWTSVEAASGRSVSRNQLLSALLSRLFSVLSSYESDGFRCYRDKWNEMAAYLGEQVLVSQGEQRFLGVMKGVDDEGALRLEIDGQEHLFHGGEVSMRSVL